MKEITIGGVKINFSFNEPLEETGYISEDFNYQKQPVYATSDVVDLINSLCSQIIVGKIFQILYEQSKVQKLDYLQKLTINNGDVWALHNGEYMTLLLPENY